MKVKRASIIDYNISQKAGSALLRSRNVLMSTTADLA